MRIQTNLAALNAQRNLSATNAALQVTTTRLSSGFRINRAADDAAGLSIANQMRGDIRALQTASRNASQAGSVLQIADNATSTIASILDRMKELATQAASSNTTPDARTKLQSELSQLQQEIDRIVGSTKFQGTTLLNGSFGVQMNSNVAVSTLLGAGDNAASNERLYTSEVSVAGAKSNAVYTVTVAGGRITLTGVDDANQDGVANAGEQTFATQTLDFESGTVDGDVQRFNFDRLGVSFAWSGGIAAATGAPATTGADGLNNLVLATGAASGGIFRIHSGTDPSSTLNLSLGSLLTEDLGIGVDDISLGTYDDAVNAIDALDSAYSRVNDVIGQIGAATNRLEFASTNLGSIIQNTMAAESTIRDADMAYEMMQFSKQNILAQAGTAMLAQANQLGQGVLQLLQAA